MISAKPTENLTGIILEGEYLVKMKADLSYYERVKLYSELKILSSWIEIQFRL